MPRGCPRLPVDVKQGNVLRSRKLYEEKNAEKRREAARVRMQRKRAEIDEDFRLKYARRHKAALASARYRHRKQQREVAESKHTRAETRRTRKEEGEDLRRKHHADATPAPPPLARRHRADSPRRLSDIAQEDDEIPATGVKTCRRQLHARRGTSHRRTATHLGRAGRVFRHRPFSSIALLAMCADASTASKRVALAARACVRSLPFG
ncbi:hypothetical protein K438DRAFT_1992113 [Mycena galopus ATCC 62051]|nr:hypothetical protein K438DRAFT_1992113 [Mycena galopus ATCC 62051]